MSKEEEMSERVLEILSDEWPGFVWPINARGQGFLLRGDVEHIVEKQAEEIERLKGDNARLVEAMMHEMDFAESFHTGDFTVASIVSRVYEIGRDAIA